MFLYKHYIDLENKLIPREKRIYSVSFKVKPEEKGLEVEVPHTLLGTQHTYMELIYSFSIMVTN